MVNALRISNHNNGGWKRLQQPPLSHRRSDLNLRGGLEITLWNSRH